MSLSQLEEMEEKEKKEEMEEMEEEEEMISRSGDLVWSLIMLQTHFLIKKTVNRQHQKH